MQKPSILLKIDRVLEPDESDIKYDAHQVSTKEGEPFTTCPHLGEVFIPAYAIAAKDAETVICAIIWAAGWAEIEDINRLSVQFHKDGEITVVFTPEEDRRVYAGQDWELIQLLPVEPTTTPEERLLAAAKKVLNSLKWEEGRSGTTYNGYEELTEAVAAVEAKK